MPEPDAEMSDKRARILQRNIEESKRLLDKKHASHEHATDLEGEPPPRDDPHDQHQSVPPTRIGGPASSATGNASRRQGGARTGLH